MGNGLHIEQIWKIAGEMHVAPEEVRSITEIVNAAGSVNEISTMCFAYGKIVGKQEEQRRRKDSTFLKGILDRIEGDEKLERIVYAYVNHLPKKITAPGGNPEAVKKDGRPSQSNLSLPSLPEKSKEGQG